LTATPVAGWDRPGRVLRHPLMGGSTRDAGRTV